jgi:MYXO-CTERM domain-containing protein
VTTRILILVFTGALLLGPLGGTALAGHDCQTTADCDPNEVCVDNACEPEGACLSNSDCGSGNVCYFGDCTTACGATSDCMPGETCQDGACVPSDTVSGQGRGTMGCQLSAGAPGAGGLAGTLLMLGALLALRRRSR